MDGPTQHIPTSGHMDAPTQNLQLPGAGPDGAGGQPPTTPPSGKAKNKRGLADPTSIVLILVIVIALAAAGLIGAELYARHVADNKVSQAAQCVSEDSAAVSFSAMPPFLWQHWNGHYDNITITTAGNQIQSAKGMKAVVVINDVDLHGNSNSKGTIGSLDATITWTTEGIKQTIQDAIPIFGSFLSGVKTSGSDGTITIEGTLGDIVAKPEVVNNKIQLKVVSLSGLGFVLPSESVQPALDGLTDKLASDLPLNIKAQSIQVTDSGVSGKFSTRNATIPLGSQNACFANL
jgi:hypothetical protein